MGNTVWVLYHEDSVDGIFTSYRKAIHALMMRTGAAITHFESYMDIDMYIDGEETVWTISETELDKI